MNPDVMEGSTHPRRYAKACDACHKKKIRCVYREPACELCRKTGEQCKFTRIEKANSKRPRRGKHVSALEQRMINMENLLLESRDKRVGRDELKLPDSPSLYDDALKAINSRDVIMRSENGQHHKDLRLPSKDYAIRLVQGYFACFNHLFPIFDKDSFLYRMHNDYPPSKDKGLTWWTAVVTVLCYAHRLRAMSTPGQAEAENEEACRYLKEALDLAPRLTYSKPSIESAQVLLGIASTLRGTKIPDPASMLIAAAIRMLQHLGAQKEDPSTMDLRERKQRERAFWVAYILDKEAGLQNREPPVIHEQDIGRSPLADQQEDDVGVVRSLDSRSEVNLFAVSQRLASIQGLVWSRTHSAAAGASRAALEAAENDLSPTLAAWKDSLPFEFTKDALVGRWPKYAIVQIVVLHFRYFQTLVELNRVPPTENDEPDPLKGGCPIAKSLPLYSHSVSTIAAEAARNALDLASLTPRGNFQNIWLFFQSSISAVLTLLVNSIVRPLNEHASDDLRRVDVWLRVIDRLATDSERPDLLEKRDFLQSMQQWTLRVMQDAVSGEDSGVRDMPCIQEFTGSYPGATVQMEFDQGNSIWDASWIPTLNYAPFDVFPDGLLNAGDIQENWPSSNDVGVNDVY